MGAVKSELVAAELLAPDLSCVRFAACSEPRPSIDDGLDQLVERAAGSLHCVVRFRCLGWVILVLSAKC